MNLKSEYIRHSNLESEKTLSERLGFNWIPKIQDWSLAFSDKGRVSSMKLEHFTRDRIEIKKGKTRTVNVDQNLHLFLKRTTNHYNIAISDLVHNILISWKENYEDQIKDEMFEQFKDS